MQASKSIIAAELPCDLLLTIEGRLGIEVDRNEVVSTTKCLRANNVLYATDNCFVLDVVEENIPVFIIVKLIVCVRGTWVLCGRLAFCKRFHRKLHAYSIDIDDDWAMFRCGEEIDSSVHHTFVLHNTSFVTLKYAVVKV